MFVPTAIGFVRSRYQQTADVPRGFGARHDAEGVLELQPEFEAGLTDTSGKTTSLHPTFRCVFSTIPDNPGELPLTCNPTRVHTWRSG
jgi:hypothetical protein